MNWSRWPTRVWVAFSVIWMGYVFTIFDSEIGYAYRYYTDNENLKVERRSAECLSQQSRIIKPWKMERKEPPSPKAIQQHKECVENYKLRTPGLQLMLFSFLFPPFVVGLATARLLRQLDGSRMNERQ